MPPNSFIWAFGPVVSALKAIVGAWLRGLGGSAYYLLAGILMLACGVLLLKRYASAVAA